jgi:hypothetical protein
MRCWRFQYSCLSGEAGDRVSAPVGAGGTHDVALDLSRRADALPYGLSWWTVDVLPERTTSIIAGDVTVRV